MISVKGDFAVGRVCEATVIEALVRLPATNSITLAR